MTKLLHFQEQMIKKLNLNRIFYRLVENGLEIQSLNSYITYAFLKFYLKYAQHRNYLRLLL